MWRTKSQRTWCSLTFVLFVHVSALLLCNLASLSVKLSLFFWRSSRESLWCCRQLDEWAPTRCACWDSGYHGDVQFWLDNASFFSFFFAAVSQREIKDATWFTSDDDEESFYSAAAADSQIIFTQKLSVRMYEKKIRIMILIVMSMFSMDHQLVRLSFSPLAW